MKLKRILLDHLWTQRKEGIDFLEDLFKHFDKINSGNIGRNLCKKFGISGNLVDSHINSNLKIKRLIVMALL